MPTINQLSAVDALAAGDLVPVYSQANGDARKSSLTVLAAFIQSLLTAVDDKVTQYAAPSATAFTVTIPDTDESVWLVLTPVADYANGTIVLPSAANAADKQEVLVNSTHAITGALAITSAGGTVTGAPATITANAFFRLRFEAVTKTWYRVG